MKANPLSRYVMLALHFKVGDFQDNDEEICHLVNVMKLECAYIFQVSLEMTLNKIDENLCWRRI